MSESEIISESLKVREQNTQDRREAFSEKLDAQERRLNQLEIELTANTAATARVEANTAGMVSTMQSWTGAMETIESVGKFLKPCTYVVAFCTAIISCYVAVKNALGDR